MTKKKDLKAEIEKQLYWDLADINPDDVRRLSKEHRVNTVYVNSRGERALGVACLVAIPTVPQGQLYVLALVYHLSSSHYEDPEERVNGVAFLSKQQGLVRIPSDWPDPLVNNPLMKDDRSNVKTWLFPQFRRNSLRWSSTAEMLHLSAKTKTSRLESYFQWPRSWKRFESESTLLHTSFDARPSFSPQKVTKESELKAEIEKQLYWDLADINPDDVGAIAHHHRANRVFDDRTTKGAWQLHGPFLIAIPTARQSQVYVLALIYRLNYTSKSIPPEKRVKKVAFLSKQQGLVELPPNWPDPLANNVLMKNNHANVKTWLFPVFHSETIYWLPAAQMLHLPANTETSKLEACSRWPVDSCRFQPELMTHPDDVERSRGDSKDSDSRSNSDNHSSNSSDSDDDSSSSDDDSSSDSSSSSS